MIDRINDVLFSLMFGLLLNACIPVMYLIASRFLVVF